MKKWIAVFALAIFCYIFCDAQKCGFGRWSIKTLSDADTIKIDFNNVHPSSITEQTSMKRSIIFGKARQPSETQVYSIACVIIAFKREPDKDIHFIIEDTLTHKKMVAEIISPDCDAVKKTS